MSAIPSDFLAAIRHRGLTAPDQAVADGEIHRFRSGPEHGMNGFYRLVVLPAHGGGEIGFGLIGCWKRDVNEKWCSRDPAALAEPDRRAMRKARDDMRRKDEEAARQAAAKAGSIWSAAGAADPAHPYLAAKGVGPKGLRQYKDKLLVPVRRDGVLTSLQFIGPDGVKRFLTGGRVDGGYASLGGKDAGRDVILIAEGYATAASLNAATGLPAVVAFNAGNLLAVATAVRGKYPEARLVVAGDHDQWTVVRGEKRNVGRERAVEAAKAVGGGYVLPLFPADDPDRGTDWNDYALRHGLEATKRAFDAMAGLAPPEPPEPSPPPPEPPPHDGSPDYPAGDVPDPAPPWARTVTNTRPGDWKGRLIPGKEVAEGHPFPFDGKSKTNAHLFLTHHPRFEGMLCYNEFTDAVMLTRRPPWEHGDFAPRSLRDDDFFMLAANLEYCDISVSKDTAADAAVRVAKEHPINPPREFLARLAWDGTRRLDTWLTYYLGADDQPAEYLALVGAKWLIGAVSRVFEPGCKFDSVLILEGTQGLEAISQAVLT